MAQEAATDAQPDRERRIVTALFCDLVDSTRLSTVLDPEDLDDLYAGYEQLVARVVLGFGGSFVSLIGDGAVAIFGYPVQREDDAERAIRAGLALAGQIPEIKHAAPWPLQARVALATGPALVSAGHEGRPVVVGAVQNLAARLQTRAEPGTVVVCPSTRNLALDRFSYSSRGEHRLKGFDLPVAIWRVDGVRHGARPPGGRHQEAETPLVGRDTALGRLEQNWRDAQEIRSAAVAVIGEAGIGKSRLMHAFSQRVSARRARVIWIHCSSLFTASPLYPLLGALSGAARITPEDDDEARDEKLRAMFVRVGLGSEEAGPLTDWLRQYEHVPDPAAVPSIAEEALVRLKAALQRLVAAWSGFEPLLLVAEDVHWADPTTADLLARLARDPPHGCLLALTSRGPSWPGVDTVNLDRLDGSETRRIIAELDRQGRLTEAARDRIAARSEGVPLFVVELTHSSLEAGQAPSVPETLTGSLLARLGTDSAARQVAQGAAVLGGDVSPELTASLADLPPAAAAAGMAELVRRSVFIAQDSGGFGFRHALLAQAIYESIPRRRRRLLHARAADILPRLSPRTVSRFPELIAEHLTRAERPAEAASQWLSAGRQAVARSAIREAEQHFLRGVSLVGSIADAEAGRALELELRIALAPVLIATRGPRSPEVAECYRYAQKLGPGLFESLWGQWRTEPTTTRQLEIGHGMLAVAEAGEEADLVLEARHALWASAFNAGDIDECLEHVEHGLRLHDPARHLALAARFAGHDAGCCGLGVAALARWVKGETDEARRLAERAVRLGSELEDALSLAHALDYAATLHQHLGDGPATRETAEELIRVASRHGLSLYETRGRIFLGWSLTATGEAAAGAAMMTEAIEALRRSGEEDDFTVLACMAAEGRAASGDVGGALASLDEFIKPDATRGGVRYWDSEVLRLRGRLLDRLGNLEAARLCLERAYALARGRAHAMLVLRSASDLACVLDGTEATGMLGAALSAMPANASCADVERARRVLGGAREDRHGRFVCSAP